MLGGKALASGSFGCVFKPSLATTAAARAQPGVVSKLMSTADAEEEYGKTQWLISLLAANMSNYERYFILPSVPVAPLPLQPEDLLNFERTCAPFFSRVSRVFRGGMKRGASSSLSPARPSPVPVLTDERVRGYLSAANINRNLSQLMVINQVDGGDALFDVFANGVTEDKLVEVLTALAALAEGIKQMSELGVMHMDVKVENVVYDGVLARLIDWGLAARVTDYVTEDEGPGRNERPFPIVRTLPPGSLLLPSRLQEQLQQLHIPHVKSASTGLHFERYVYGDALATYMVACKQFADMQQDGNQGAELAEWLDIMEPQLPAAYKDRLASMGDRVKVMGMAIQNAGVRDTLMNMDSLLAGVYFCQLREIVEVYVDLLPSNRLMVRRGAYIREVFVPNADLHGLTTGLYVILMGVVQCAAEDKVMRVASFLMYKYLYSGMFATMPISVVELVADLSALSRVAQGQSASFRLLDLRKSNAEELVAQGTATVKEVEGAAKEMVRVISASMVLFE